MADDDGVKPGLVDELWSTPVGRRWLLKAGLGSVVTAAGAGLFGGSVAGAAARSAAGGGGVVSSDLQFALGAVGGVSDLVLVANGERYGLVAHSRASRAVLRARGGLWRAMDLGVLTHYVDGVELPAGRGLLVWVEGVRGGRGVLVSELWHAPAQATLGLARAAHRLTGSLDHVGGSGRRLAELGLGRGDVRSAEQVVQLDSVVDPYQTAAALTMSHPQVSTVDPMAVATTKAVLDDTAPVQDLGSYLGQMQRGGRDFASLEQAVDPDGSPSVIVVGDVETSFSTIRLNDSDSRFMAATRASVSGGITAVRDTGDLGVVIDRPLDEDPSASTATWVQPQGVVPTSTPYDAQLRARGGLEIKIKNPGVQFGTKTVVNGSYHDGKVPLKIYNNFVRWVWVYVQYLGPGNKNLSIDPNAKFPDTKYSKSVCIVPQVFTVFGAPLWDTNTVEVSLKFPEGAHTARLLYCGLGSDIYGGGWRQYFPADAYPDRIAPTDEVLYAALTTGMMCIGLNAFALAADFPLAVAHGTRADLSDAMLAAVALDSLSKASGILTAVEAFTTTVTSGAATYLDIKNRGENIDNLWNLLLGFATIFPKIVFNAKAGPTWATLASSILEYESASRVINAIPIIGQVLGVATGVGDAVTLAEVGAETTVSPWVIENEVSLDYPAVVTVSRDSRASTFPVTARSWRLEALVDGALALDPITGEINQGGRVRSDALVLDVSAPFGGRQIQWSFVLLDGRGNQVGTGVSGVFGNDDPKHPASVVGFSITQLPAVITSSTVFERADTTAYSEQAGGYTWSDAVRVVGTVRDAGVQEVAGASVATLDGWAGIVFKQEDRYYLRSVPLAQNGATIRLGVARKEGYSRRPFLLLDPFVGEGDRGNHVLVEPDVSTSGYVVRRVSRDPDTGEISWDQTSSLGMFLLPVSACALHAASGRVVAVNTDSGRLAWLQLVAAGGDRPQLASYAAGPGTQVGLLSSPVSIAVTNQGTVLVLEAAASPQISAFDLNGNPVRYFAGKGSELEYTLALFSKGTYLDVAVDGASQIYVLHFIGDGSRPSDYHVDVYTDKGFPLDTASPGVNVPHLAVDYWRSIFGANYSALPVLGTDTPYINPGLRVAEPSLSRFDPTEPS